MLHSTTTKEYKDWLKKKLNEGVVKIGFLKVNGSHREMKCTLNSELIDSIIGESIEGEKTRKESNDALNVFDIEKEDWRSFRWDRLRSIEL